MSLFQNESLCKAFQTKIMHLIYMLLENLYMRSRVTLIRLFSANPFSCMFINILKSRWLHWIFLHFHHTNDPLFSTRVKSQSLLGWGVSDVLCCLGFLCNLGWLCSCYSRGDFFFQCFSSFSCCL